MDFDLIVVGMGPVGAAAANLAGLKGLKTLVVDKALEIYKNPRAMGMDHEVMRVLAEIGIADEIAPFVMPYRASEYHSTGSRIIKRIDAAQKPYPLGWAPNYVFVQPEIECALRAKAASYPHVEVRLETEVTAVESSEGMVSVALKGRDTAPQTVTARYVLACDGGASPIRTALGVELEDLDFDEPWLVVDVTLNEGAGAALPLTNVQYCETGRPTTFVVGVGQHRRWEFMINPDEAPEDVAKPEYIRQLLARWLDPDEYTLWRASTYRFHALVSRTWRLDNIFFLGDAAHMTPPFLAQGLCQGIRDASNLMWKLALVLSGQAGPELLNTYQPERVTHVKKTTLVTKEFGQLICERDPEKAAMRDEHLMQQMAANPGGTVRQSLIPNLVGGFLAPEPFTLQGELLPQSELRDSAGRRGLLDSFTGGSFRLILSADVDPTDVYRELESNPALVGLSVKLVKLNPSGSPAVGPDGFEDLNGVMTQWMSSRHCKVALGRPDHYVYGAGRSGTDAAGLLKAAGTALNRFSPADSARRDVPLTTLV
ncbi:bifunctional 3-(3-hydroxy-phenyl)propionate/3-hydroxycinnamic acid hydroxylase [Paraburkholderia sediminicola]|jgi:2-polyprenyl-6-methoxyphenol hydroxylase and related FAD-dependent oxidoreductases|nr:bifunctional 3-(3-hydroxy-phenyl)propionate/3-hydroxycinnamic acid hydroxylase [Paraburkholderia sediminicola]